MRLYQGLGQLIAFSIIFPDRAYYRYTRICIVKITFSYMGDVTSFKHVAMLEAYVGARKAS